MMMPDDIIIQGSILPYYVLSYIPIPYIMVPLENYVIWDFRLSYYPPFQFSKLDLLQNVLYLALGINK